jgi:DNA-binding XRE family transcriptional regulator
MKDNSWEVEIPEDDHGEGVDIMAIVEADLATDPDEAALVAEIEQGSEVVQRRYTMTLSALRQALGVTQVELAKRMGVGQPAVSALERNRRADMLLSTLAGYLEAVGLHARFVVELPDSTEVEVDLSALLSGDPSEPMSSTTSAA